MPDTPYDLNTEMEKEELKTLLAAEKLYLEAESFFPHRKAEIKDAANRIMQNIDKAHVPTRLPIPMENPDLYPQAPGTRPEK